ncbi:MAG: radical SAM family heme chaperone HemW [Nitrospirota bacterium]|nr:radical SAM family heme chaperone HemW [Nitrospirota bacterium]
MSAAIYIHIPFCIKKCNYCDFYSIPFNEPIKDRYLKALMKEIEMTPFAGKVETIYIGGGTPSLLSPSEVEAIINKLEQKFHISHGAEITLEVNPGTINLHKVRALSNTGINRLSIGIQSLNPDELNVLGRVHDEADSRNTMEWTSRYFDNFSVDIIYGIPGQDPEGLRDTLKQVLSYNPPHISAYELSVERGTPLSCMLSEGKVILPADDDKIAMYELTADLLAEKGYLHYEISNYSLKGFHCRHNMNYWMRGEYLGFGVSAHALVQETRLRNTADISDYIRLMEEKGRAAVEEIALTDLDRINEEIFLKLRTDRGFNTDTISTSTGLLHHLEQEGLILKKNGWIRLTERGMLLSNRVIVEILDSIEKTTDIST